MKNPFKVGEKVITKVGGREVEVVVTKLWLTGATGEVKSISSIRLQRLPLNLRETVRSINTGRAAFTTFSHGILLAAVLTTFAITLGL